MKILVADDEVTSRNILEHILTRWGYAVVPVADGNEALKRLQRADAPRLAVLDWMMPGIEGIEICRKLREKEKNGKQYTYVILLTAKDSKASIIEGMEAGADDYIIKPFDQNEMRVRIRAGQRILQLQSELLATQKDLLRLSRVDPLTGVLNRRAILSQIEVELSRAQRENQKVSIAMLDIDHFKKVNDTYGHMAGDVVLRECVKRINAVARTYDSLGRFGGEEFLIVIPGPDEEEVFSICERIRLAVNATDIPIDGSSVRVTVSQGMVVWDGNAHIDDLIVVADQALYLAKKNGRNRVERSHAQYLHQHASKKTERRLS